MIDHNLITQQLLGDVDLNFLIASWIIAIVGGTLNAILYSLKGTKDKTNQTPLKWDLWYFLKDNAKRFISGMIILFVYARFGNELMGQTLTLGFAFLIGFFIDWVMVFFYKKFHELKDKFFPSTTNEE